KKIDQVIVVDDGSSDATAEIAEALGVKVLKHPQNLGYGAAIKTCFKAARKLNADAMVILDADEQHNPDDIPFLLNKIKEGSDIVIGSRFLENSKMPTYRKFGIDILNLAMRWAGVKVSDCQSGFRAYSKKAIREIDLQEEGMSISSEILYQAKGKNLKISEVPIVCNYAVENPSSENPLVHGLTVLLSIVRLIEFSRPLQFFGLIGIPLFGAGVAFGVWVLRSFNSTGSLPLGPTLIMTLLVLLGIFTLYTGIILHSIARLWSEKKSGDKNGHST
ncbi:MAG: glycosyltransferase, partial [Deltaproteobacteria bacterium]|nr:glycosyltransferase [Deltaproteobacteria bacterium]